MPENLRATHDGTRLWFGMVDYQIHAPAGYAILSLPYISEPPHGDSVHRILVNDHTFPGFAWGNSLAWSPCSRYVALDWTAQLRTLTRNTIVLDVHSLKYFVLPEYVLATRFAYPRLYRESEGNEGLAFEFSGQERWAESAA